MARLKAESTKGQVIPFMQDGALFYKKGIEAYEKHDMDQAIHYIERAIQIEPDESVFPCQLSIFLSEQGKYEEANEWLEKILTHIDKTMYECYFFLANNYAHLGEFEQAKYYINKYLDREPKGEFAEDAHSLLFFLDEELVDDEDIDWEEDQSFSKLHHIFESLYRGEFELAEELARLAVAESPREWDAYAYLAEALLFQGDMKEAKSILQNLLLKEEPNFLARCIYTLLLAKTDQKEADEWVKNIKDLHPMDDWHSYYLGKTLFFLGEYDRANDWFRKLFRKYEYQSSPMFMHQRAILACRRGMLEKAVSLWEEAKHLGKENGAISDQFIQLLKKEELLSYPDEQIFIYAKLRLS